MKLRANRMAEEVKKELMRIIRYELKDPRIDGLVSVTDVEMSGDLSYAVIYVSKYGDQKAREDALAGLEAAKGFIRRELSKKLKTRIVPEMVFKLDESLIYGAKIEAILSEIKDAENASSNEQS